MQTDHIQQIRNQSKYDYIPQEPENLRFAPVIVFLHFHFAFLKDIIDNNTMHGLYSPYYVTRTSTNDRAVYWSHDTDRDTRQPLVEVLVT